MFVHSSWKQLVRIRKKMRENTIAVRYFTLTKISFSRVVDFGPVGPFARTKLKRGQRMHELVVINERFRTNKRKSNAKLTAEFRDGAYNISLGDHHWAIRSDWVSEPPENDDVAFIGAVVLAMSNDIEFHTDLRVTEGCLRSIERLRYALRILWPRKIYFPDFHIGTSINNPGTVNRNGVLCVSGGLDSTFAAFLNSKNKNSGQNYGMVMIGADYDHDDDPRNDVLRQRTQKLCDRFELEMKAVEISPSFPKIVHWRMFHPTVLWMLTKYLEPKITKSAIAADYSSLSEFGTVPWGNCSAIINSLDDPTFPFSHVGLEHQRFEKMAALVDEAPDIIPNIIACGKLTREGKNCGKCGKCIRTQLNLEAAGHPMPEIFDAQPDLIKWLRARHPYRSQFKLRSSHVWALEHEVSLPEGPLRDAAVVYRKNIEASLIPRGRI